ncbi:4-coumarate--CoA ligase, photoactive yellow protein activation family [Nannocystis exedens]|uniref:4-coumarate--CoA ligase, photoactive yellow protein activation family n=1 Tax=Nannocystis exedens TaxID=54 RepID=A0A1I2H4A9_9BACT|nr:AMP-binding protein [Nannocystis exedens]PCC67086.1 AMP-dependent ligase [Nannocystis exedens]SFF23511.1 4-coumarate--CoA ligase, photoactive yellow protein activation family [Nannocystis exedens]
MKSFVPLVHTDPAAPVAVGEAGARTAGELMRDARAVARRLPAAAPGSEVLVVCGDRYHLAVTTLAAWLRGHAVALPPNAQPAAVRELAGRPSVVALLHDSDLTDAQDVREWLDGHVLEDMTDPTWPEALAAERRLAVVYTSGSTGDHQPCAKTAAQLLGEAQALAATFALQAGEVALATVPPYHLYGLLFGILAPLAAGAAFARETPLHAETVARAARQVGATVLVSTPAHLRGLTVLERGDLPPLSRVFSSGAPLPRATADELLARLGLQVTEVYGSSETGGIGWRRHEHVLGDMSTEPAWTPLPGVTVEVAGEGRLLLRSPFLAPDAPVPYPCEDRVEVDARGGFHLRGRLDGVVKIAGKRVAVAEVEQRLLALPAVADAAVVAVESPGARGHELVAAVVPREAGREAGELVAELRRALLPWFDPVVVPRRIKLVPALPREPSGKLTRRKLHALLGLAVEADSPASEAASGGRAEAQAGAAAGDSRDMSAGTDGAAAGAAAAASGSRDMSVRTGHEAQASSGSRAMSAGTGSERDGARAGAPSNMSEGAAAGGGATAFALGGHVRRDEGGVSVHEVEVGVPVDLAFFRGHFDALPVLPGVAQLTALVVPQVAALRPELGPLRRAARLKFTRPVAPGDALVLRLEVRGTSVRFSLARAGEVVTAGALEYEARGG